MWHHKENVEPTKQGPKSIIHCASEGIQQKGATVGKVESAPSEQLPPLRNQSHPSKKAYPTESTHEQGAEVALKSSA